MPPKPNPKPLTNFAALRHYAHVSYSVAHSGELYFPDIPRDELRAQEAAHEAKLTEAIMELRRKIMDEEMALSTLKSKHPTPESLDLVEIPEAPQDKLRKLKILKIAHERGFDTIDYIPSADSPLNILLAFRSVETVIANSNISIPVVEQNIKSAQLLLKTENAALREQTRLMEALRTRLEALEAEERSKDIGTDIVRQKDLIKQVAKKKKEVTKRTTKLLRELLYFLDAGLARMLAAEEMGGPVVGGDLDVTLETGFDKRGNVKKGNRRIDEMWGQGEEDPEKKMVQEFKDMLEELMNASLKTSPYVQLKKDSAVVRFLVRSKVAVFHPKDARRLRLVDFGSNVEDG